MKKSTKMKTGKGIVTGLLAGAAVGALTFLFVKPKTSAKKKEQISNNLQLDKKSKTNSENLFI